MEIVNQETVKKIFRFNIMIPFGYSIPIISFHVRYYKRFESGFRLTGSSRKRKKCIRIRVAFLKTNRIRPSPRNRIELAYFFVEGREIAKKIAFCLNFWGMEHFLLFC